MSRFEPARRAVLLLVLGALAAGPILAAPAPDRPNILLLVAEDLSPRLGAFGDPIARTPTLDRLAAEGARFTNVFTTAGVCAPSRAALILGQHQIATGSQHMRTSTDPESPYLSVPPPHVKAFPELLRRAGYFTFQHGKLDYQFSGPRSGSGPSSIWDTEDNEDAWRDRESGQPFFGMLNFHVTHESGVFPPLGRWPTSFIHLLMQLMQTSERWGYVEHVVPTDPATVVMPPYYPDLPELRTDLARHYDNIQIMDAQVASLLERLEADGLLESTIVIFTTDHGDGLPRAKRELFDSGLRVPLIVRWPETLRPAHLSTGDVDRQLISFVDLSATILAMAGVEAPASLHGRDLLDPSLPPREYVFAARDRIDEVHDRQRAVRDRRFKYIRSFHPELPGGHPLDFRDHQTGVRAWQRAYAAGELDPTTRRWFEPPGEERLFDLDRDPHELHDRSMDPAYRATLERMRSTLDAFIARVGDLGAIPEAELRERFWPGGEQPATAPPAFARVGDRLALSSPTPGASIEYAVDRGRWRLYVDPVALADGQSITARAVRYGWQASPVITWEVD